MHRSIIGVTTTTGWYLCVRPYFMFSFSFGLVPFFHFSIFLPYQIDTRTLGPGFAPAARQPQRDLRVKSASVHSMDNNQCIGKRRHGLHWGHPVVMAPRPDGHRCDSIGHADCPCFGGFHPMSPTPSLRAFSSDSSVFPGTCRKWEIVAISAVMEAHPAPERVLHYRVLKHGLLLDSDTDSPI